MKNKRKKKTYLIALILALALTGCGTTTTEEASEFIHEAPNFERSEKETIKNEETSEASVTIIEKTGDTEEVEEENIEDADEIDEEEEEITVEEELEYEDAIGKVWSYSSVSCIYEEKDLTSEISGYLYKNPIELIEIYTGWAKVQNREAGIVGYVALSDVEYTLDEESVDTKVVEEETEVDETEEETIIEEFTEVPEEVTDEDDETDIEETSEVVSITEDPSNGTNPTTDNTDDITTEVTDIVVEEVVSVEENTTTEIANTTTDTDTTTNTYVIATDYETINERMKEALDEDEQELYEICDELSTNRIAYIGDESVSDIMYFFCNRYTIVKPNGTNAYSTGYSSTDGTYIELLQQKETLELRKAAVSAVISTVGVEQVSDPYTAVRNACSRARSVLTYNSSYVSASLTEALSSGYGVCVHYARCANIILNAEGIKCRIVTGTLDGESHAWNEVYIDGEWIPIDFTQNNTTDGFITSEQYTHYKS